MKKTKNTIVLIDDDKWLVDLYGEKLRLENFNIYTAHNGKDGVALILKHHPDLVLSDVVMAGGDGFYVLKEMKKNPLIKDIPVISLTNLGNDQDKKALLDMGSVDYLVKADFTPSQVVEKIRRIIKKFEDLRTLAIPRKQKSAIRA